MRSALTTTGSAGTVRGGGGQITFGLAGRPVLHEVRGWTATAVPQVSGELLEDLLLVVTELVSNAYDHGRHALSLRLGVYDDRVRVEVTDACTAPPVPGRSRIAETRGRGLVLIAALSADWGYCIQAEVKTVWAELPVGTG